MIREASLSSLLVAGLVALSGCGSQTAAPEAKKAPVKLDKIQGKTQVNLSESSSSDAALNGGGQSIYLISGVHRYRLFFKTKTEVEPGNEYIAEGIFAQKAIDEIGDPANGASGYPLQASCDKVVRQVWGNGLAFDVLDGYSTVLKARIKRYPARPVFLVTKLTAIVPKDGDEKKPKEKEKEIPEVNVAPDKQVAMLIEGPKTQPAPLWAPEGGVAKCKVIINDKGEVGELETGAQLCEAVPWDQFKYKPTVQAGHPVKVKTEVEVNFESKKST